ncbi:unnamed protein product [Rhizophagus irregularis]|nr:unnamed protein product [Rhizophagus irregularis]
MAQYDALDSQYAHLFSDSTIYHRKLIHLSSTHQMKDRLDCFNNASIEQSSHSPYPTRITQSLQVSSLNQSLQMEHNKLLSNLLNIEPSRISQKVDSPNCSKNNGKDNFNYNGARNENNQGTNTLGTTGQITGIKRSNNICSLPGNYEYTGQVAKRPRAVLII